MFWILVCQVKITEKQIKSVKQCWRKCQGREWGVWQSYNTAKLHTVIFHNFSPKFPTWMATMHGGCCLVSCLPHPKASQHTPSQVLFPVHTFCFPCLFFTQNFSSIGNSVPSNINLLSWASPGQSPIHYLHLLSKKPKSQLVPIPNGPGGVKYQGYPYVHNGYLLNLKNSTYALCVFFQWKQKINKSLDMHK